MKISFFLVGCLYPIAGASRELNRYRFAESIHSKLALASHHGVTGLVPLSASAEAGKNSIDSSKPFAILPKHDRRLLKSSESSSIALQEESQQQQQWSEETSTCDVQFMECLNHPKCTSCFKDMDSNGIDWSIVAPDSPCDNVLDALILKAGYCTDLGINQSKDLPERETFCRTFDQCVIWKNNDDDNYNDIDNGDNHSEEDIDCSSLNSCEWKGMKPSYLGDGICHDFIDGCYNTAICNYDNGDCCPDTCVKSTSNAPFCGSDGYFCKDPKSEYAAKGGNGQNDSTNGNGSKPAMANCTADETPYKMFQYDSFGDGWDLTEMAITNREDAFHAPVYDGRLENGAEGMEYLCLSTKPACYRVNLSGGFWGNEVSWEIKPMKNGAPAMASGGAPMDCEFPVSGAHCENTCTGRANVDPAQDEKYHTYHKIADCINDKCVIQLGMCENDLVCASCIGEAVVPPYCLASDLFNALGFCTECNCIEGLGKEEKKKFCNYKSKEKHENEDDNKDENDANDPDHPDSNTSKRVRACGFDEFMDGSKAVIQYSECSQIDTLSALMTDFDPDNFGMLDAFENCASDYTKSKYGKSALDCLRILENAIVHPSTTFAVPTKNVPVRAISALANDLLNDGENFCECSTKASAASPVCKDFIHFKTLLYESLDGCRALDAIDCAAWAEFYIPCKSNLIDKFEKVDFRRKAQCQYAQDRCGNVGPFPSFRRMDCGEEISEESWDFYLDYERNCMRDGQGPAPGPTPKAPAKPIPVATLSPSANRDKKAPYNPSSNNKKEKDVPVPIPVPVPSNTDSSTKKKYVPPEKRGKSGGGSGTHKFRNFIIFCVLAGGVYWYLKNRYGLFNFDYNQFRRARNYDGYENSAMYDSLSMQNNQATFEPPTLPPHPTVYENGGNDPDSFHMSNMSPGQDGFQ